LWDAIQYDPIFNNANTWQVYFGAPYQAAAQIPTGGWFRLRVQAVGQRAAISVNDQAPLVVERLAHPLRAGHFGLWTYRPAYYADLRVSPCTRLDAPSGTVPSAPPGAVEAWWLQGIGATACEPHGVLNLNRYLSASQSPASLERQFELPKPAEVLFEFGFSDSLLLELDGQELFRGERRFAGLGDRFDRGYAELGDHSVRQSLSAGQHTLRAQVNVSEPFGWGLALAAHAPGLRWLPLERTNTA
jgi:hypothetical protein